MFISLILISKPNHVSEQKQKREFDCILNFILSIFNPTHCCLTTNHHDLSYDQFFVRIPIECCQLPLLKTKRRNLVRQQYYCSISCTWYSISIKKLTISRYIKH